ncbi:hypothetical protein THAOC_12170 [Thalassiosira oceanica]|uniref:CRAL-TRIO domain-containing protein n=1 Tax=Thalassiosira oceanica TaxID=159749 RepID=K0SKN8_THAOC|nr:hypothetical protein THAOC_12170 [Thalassiosira oceanica]|eukprot:EJK66863.1 hypothetical protein THAOC_12170 [Thalassiosira oceanica]
MTLNGVRSNHRLVVASALVALLLIVSRKSHAPRSHVAAAAAANVLRRRRSHHRGAIRIHDTCTMIRGGQSGDNPLELDGAAPIEPTPNADDGIDYESSISMDIAADAAEPPRNLTFSATKPFDGSVEDPDGIPTRFMQMKKDNREEAKESFEAHLEWRKEHGIDNILSQPHPRFDVCKALVPAYFAGRDQSNNVVFVQRPAAIDFKMMNDNNSSIEELLRHYMYTMEYCWNILEPGPPEGVMTSVVDMKGMRFRMMKNQEYIGFGKKFVSMMSNNYPGRSYKTLIINAPTWFHALYKIFKPLLRESTRQKIAILKAGEDQDTALKLCLGDALPNELVSKTDEPTQKKPGERYFFPVSKSDDCEPGPNSLVEYEMRKFCINQLVAHNETIEAVQ